MTVMKFAEEATPNWEREIKMRFRFLGCSTVSTTNSVCHFWGDENRKVFFPSNRLPKSYLSQVAQKGLDAS
jgi:hypothetical protein